jgi:hypothetical protein
LPVDQDDRKDGAGLDRDVENFGFFVVKTEQRAGQNQVACRGDGKEFGQAFNDAHDGGFDQQCNVHAGSRNVEKDYRPLVEAAPRSLTSCSSLPPEGAARLRPGKAGSAAHAGLKSFNRASACRASLHPLP